MFPMVQQKNLTVLVKEIRARQQGPGMSNKHYITQCIGEVQRELSQPDVSVKSTAVLKMAYLCAQGYDLSSLAFEVLEVMSATSFELKRPGFLAACICFDGNTEAALLAVNLFKKGLSNPRASVVEKGALLTTLACIATQDMARDVGEHEVMKILATPNPYLRKKAVLCTFRLCEKYPQLLHSAFPKFRDLLSDEDQGVLTATVTAVTEIAARSPRNCLILAPQLWHLLVNTRNNWLTIKLLKLFQLLCPVEDRLPGKLAKPLINLLKSTKAKSVEVECILTGIEFLPLEHEAIEGECLPRLKDLLTSVDRNLRFLALGMLERFLVRHREGSGTENKGNIWHPFIVEGLKDVHDKSIRRLSLRILNLIISSENLQTMVEALLLNVERTGSTDDASLG
ncbi:AP-3 complex subunit delta-1, partial [Perkinsus olseni]